MTHTVNEPKYPIGTTFIGRGKAKSLNKVIDILKTYNVAGDLVRVRYVAIHEFCGQSVVDRDVCETTISRNATGCFPQ